MEGVTLKSRAIAFAMSAGAVAFILALLATSRGQINIDNVARALIPAIVCAVMCWASVERAVSSTASAIDAAIARLSRATRGDLKGSIPPEIAEQVPLLAESMRELFAQLDDTLQNVQRLAMFCPVTALPNRINFRQAAERALINESDQSNETLGALLFIDLDRFKRVNDTMGHAMGDVVLGMVANRLRGVADDVVAAGGVEPLLGRLAGDEFTMFLPRIASVANAQEICESVLTALSRSFDLRGNDVELGASVGIAMFPEHGENLTDLMRAADAAMYQAKAGGRGRAEQYSEALATELAARAQLETDLRRALERDEFALVFQPQIAVTSGGIVAAEALLRWRDPARGIRKPGSFIRRAEESGLIVEIGDWVITTLAKTIARWGAMGIERRIAVNISPRQIDHAEFFHRLRAAMLAANAPARLLELEITETLAMRCSTEVMAAIASLRVDGATITIDDFGTGYTNLARLRTLPLDRVKLHRSLVEHIADRHDARLIAQAVIGLIHGLRCEVVAAGIETQGQADVLRIIGCDVIQGIAVAPPMDEDAFIAWSRLDDRPMLLAG